MASGTSRGARLGNVRGKFFHYIRVGGQSESALSDTESISEQPNLRLREGSRCVNVLLLPKSVSNLSSICRAWFW